MRTPKQTIVKPATPAEPTPPTPAATTPTRSVKNDPRLQHGVLLVGSMYEHQLKAVVGDDPVLLASAVSYVLDLLGEFKARDPVERMLVSQMIQTHARAMYLNAFATQQTNLKWATMMHEAADRAANTFRRQMLALAEYRRPPRPARQFTAIGQANIASQQVVQNNGKEENGKATDEQGSRSSGAAALPAHAGGAGVPAAVIPAGEAVGVEHRAADGGR